ncbi:MAG TPA: divalent metal cation transporter, partial [Chitinophagaceae bacterium]|nr:divalent metal cation transporter [Chitinophagaceae bacterium]
EALYRTVWPEKTDMMKIVTLVGGTVGGYISFAGAHRLLDAGIKGREQLGQVTKSSVSGILITSLMRYILFLAALGVVWQGVKLSSTNPAASVFQSAAGELGYRFFGIVMWSAAITSVVGASYTSVSFWKTISPFVQRHEKWVTSLFILFSTSIFLLVGQPVKLLVLAGAVNGIILPIALAVILVAARKQKVVGEYKHSLLLQVIGWIVVVAMGYMSMVGMMKSV